MKYLMFILLLMVFAIPSLAQEQPLQYGDVVVGEITNRTYEVEYSFAGVAGDVAVISMIPENLMAGLSNPELLLLDEEFNVLTSVSASYGTAVLVFDVPSDATYVILATRRNGRGGDSQGKFTLTLSKAEVLTAGEPTEASVTSERAAYFAVRSSGSFDVSYTRKQGDFYPEISVNIIKGSSYGDTNLSTIASLKGDQLQRGSLGIDPIGSESLFIVVITEPLFQLNFSEKRVTFSLELINN